MGTFADRATRPRDKHKLSPSAWTVEMELTDAPAPGETYLTREEITSELTRSFSDLQPGLSLKIRKLILDEEK